MLRFLRCAEKGDSFNLFDDASHGRIGCDREPLLTILLPQHSTKLAMEVKSRSPASRHPMNITTYIHEYTQ
jgi:hypothetical protein